MALTTRLAGHQDGKPVYHYESPGHVVGTGAAVGSHTLADGTTYEVSPAWVEVQCDGHDEDGAPTGTCHAAELAHLVALRFVEDGHPTDSGFTYEAPTSKKGK